METRDILVVILVVLNFVFLAFVNSKLDGMFKACAGEITRLFNIIKALEAQNRHLKDDISTLTLSCRKNASRISDIEIGEDGIDYK